MDTVICGLQQIGVGVSDVKTAYDWYIKAFGMDIMICDAKGVAERMLPYTGGKPRPRRAILAVNLQGGGGMEVWEPKNEIHPAPRTELGDLGINMGRIKAQDIQKAYDHLKATEGAIILGGISTAPDGQRHFFVEDPFGNLFDIVEDGYIFVKTDCPTGGSDGAMIGVSNMEASVEYYTRLLGLDILAYDQTGIFEDLQSIPGGEGRFRRVRLSRSSYGEGPLGKVYGTYSLELIQALDRQPKSLYEGRWWGDPGFIQICLDVRNMEGIRARVQSLGQDFVCDGGDDFTMGDADGRFTYVVDPDGTMIEFVETYRIPVAKKLGISVNLRGRDPRKNLPKMLLKALRLLRVKALPVLLLAFFALSCKKEEQKILDALYLTGPTRIEVPFGGQNVSLNFRCNCDWELQVPDEASWIKASKLSDKASGSSKVFSVSLNVAANESETEREATLKFVYGSKPLTKEIQVHQASQSSMKGCGVTSITDDILFSSIPAGTSTSVQQGFEFNADRSMMYFSQVTSGYKNTISWTPRVAVTNTTTLASNKLTLLYYSHGNNIHYEKGSDGADYLWIANWGTRDSEGKYTNPQILSKIKLVNGKTYRPADAEESYYFGTKTLHASFDVENDHLAIYSQGDSYTMRIYKLSEVLATPVSDVTLKYSLTNGGTANGKTSPDAEYTGIPTVRAHDCSSLKPIATFTNNYTSTRGWQTYCIHGDKVYFFLFYKQTNPSPTGMYYQSVIDVFDFKGNKIRGDIKQPFSDNMDDLIKYGFTDNQEKYMENEGILIRDGILYLLYTAKNAAGFRRPVIFQFDANCLN